MKVFYINFRLNNKEMYFISWFVSIIGDSGPVLYNFWRICHSLFYRKEPERLATIEDIAKLAGVSHGTVSNVLNRRGNVSSKKIRLVEEAARRLGYNSNAQAQKLRQKYNRNAAFILPDIEQCTHRVFYTSLKAMLEGIGYDTNLYLSAYSIETERLCLKTALSNRPEYIIAFSCSENAGEYEKLDSRLIFINHPALVPRKNQVSFFFDFEKAAADFAEKIDGQRIRTVAFFFDFPGAPGHRVFYKSLEQRLKEKGIGTTPFFYDFRQAYHGTIAILEHTAPFDLLITDSPLYAEKLMQTRELLDYPLPKIMSLGMSETMPPSRYPRYEFDYREMARLVFSAVRDGGDYFGRSLAVKARGFTGGRIGKAPEILTGAEINMLTVVSPMAEILSSLTPYLRRCTGIRLKVAALPYEELFQMLSADRVSNIDLVRIDMAWASRFEKQLYIPLSVLGRKIESLEDSFLPSIRKFYPTERSAYSLPFDPSVQMLFYRRDLFENATIRRLYYEQTREQLEVPKTFDAYARTAAFFTAGINPASPTRFGTTMVYGTAITAACEILPRIKSMGGDLFDASGRLRVTTGIFARALNDYLEMKRFSAPEVNYWWDDALKSFSSGLSAMTVIFVNHASRIIRFEDTCFPAKVGAVPVPGGYPLLGGGAIGISRQSGNVDRCIEFLNWVYSDEITNMIALLGGLSPCKTVYGNEEVLEIYPWLRNMDDFFSRGWRRVSNDRYPRFDNSRFERILGTAVRAAALGLIPPQEALESAQRQCEEEFGNL
jgi:multiple sugar transport system substrate-binding protein